MDFLYRNILTDVILVSHQCTQGKESRMTHDVQLPFAYHLVLQLHVSIYMKEGNVLSYGFILGLLNCVYSHTNTPTKENTSLVETLSRLVNITFFR